MVRHFGCNPSASGLCNGYENWLLGTGLELANFQQGVGILAKSSGLFFAAGNIGEARARSVCELAIGIRLWVNMRISLKFNVASGGLAYIRGCERTEEVNET